MILTCRSFQGKCVFESVSQMSTSLLLEPRTVCLSGVWLPNIGCLGHTLSTWHWPRDMALYIDLEVVQSCILSPFFFLTLSRDPLMFILIKDFWVGSYYMRHVVTWRNVYPYMCGFVSPLRILVMRRARRTMLRTYNKKVTLFKRQNVVIQ